MTQKTFSWKICAKKYREHWKYSTKNTHIGNIGNSVRKKSNASRKFRAENVSRIDPSCAAMPYLSILPHTGLQLQRQQEMPFMLRNCVIKRIGPYIKKPMCDFQHLLNTQTA